MTVCKNQYFCCVYNYDSFSKMRDGEDVWKSEFYRLRWENHGRSKGGAEKNVVEGRNGSPSHRSPRPMSQEMTDLSQDNAEGKRQGEKRECMNILAICQNSYLNVGHRSYSLENALWFTQFEHTKNHPWTIIPLFPLPFSSLASDSAAHLTVLWFTMANDSIACTSLGFGEIMKHL